MRTPFTYSPKTDNDNSESIDIERLTGQFKLIQLTQFCNTLRMMTDRYGARANL